MAKRKVKEEVVEKATSKIEEVGKVEVLVSEVYENCFIVTLASWRRRVYFEDGVKFDNVKNHKGRRIEVEYIGSLSKPTEIQVLPFKVK